MMLIFMRLVFFFVCFVFSYLYTVFRFCFSLSSLWDGLDRQGAGNGPQPREIAQQVKPLAVEVWQLKPQLWWQTHTHMHAHMQGGGRWRQETVSKRLSQLAGVQCTDKKASSSTKRRELNSERWPRCTHTLAHTWAWYCLSIILALRRMIRVQGHPWTHSKLETCLI